jgi:hypothetical protein
MIRIGALLALLVSVVAMNGEAGQQLAFSTKPPALSEDDAMARFEIDEFYLPTLNVLLPDLFKWSHADNAYLV